MVTLEEYIDAKIIIKNFELIEAEKPVKNKKLFLETIHEREEMAKEAIEFAEFLGYDINPIGGREDMFDAMKKEAISQVIELREKLYEITNSLTKC
jgi:hypothetical protein